MFRVRCLVHRGVGRTADLERRGCALADPRQCVVHQQVGAGIRPDAEVPATLIAMVMNEICGADDAQQQKLSAPVMDFVPRLHEQHGKHLTDTQELRQQIAVRPVITSKVELLQDETAGQLASMVTLEGPKFERALLDHRPLGLSLGHPTERTQLWWHLA